eukprot:360460-Chlamydomonas_euryale.AAC.1
MPPQNAAAAAATSPSLIEPKRGSGVGWSFGRLIGWLSGCLAMRVGGLGRPPLAGWGNSRRAPGSRRSDRVNL